MPEEGFLRRWARVKASGGEAVVEAPRTAPAAPPVSPAPADLAVPAAGMPAAGTPATGSAAADTAQPLPTLEDAARLTPESDFSAFVNTQVDKDVRRLALKKLFADPHFKVLDRLDMYMDDYNKPDPVSATMLAALDHARGVLRRPEEVQAELARLAARDAAPAAADKEAEAATAGQPAAAEQAAPGRDDPAEADAGRTDPAQETPEQDPGAANPAEADMAPRPEPAAGTPAGAPIAPGHPLATPAIGQPGDPIALHTPRAHNAEARP